MFPCNILWIIISSFVFFSFGHCIVCPSSIYGFCLPLLYLPTFPTSKKNEDTKEVIRNRTNRQYNDQTKMEKQYDLHNTAQKTIDKIRSSSNNRTTTGGELGSSRRVNSSYSTWVSTWTIIETEAKSRLITHIHDLSISWLGPGIWRYSTSFRSHWCGHTSVFHMWA